MFIFQNTIDEKSYYASALSCAQQPLEEEFDQSDIVFFGKVVKQEYHSPELHPNEVQVTLQVLESFKGVLSSELTITSYIDQSFGWEYVEGHEMMIFATQEMGGGIFVEQLCTRSGVFPDSTMLIDLHSLKQENNDSAVCGGLSEENPIIVSTDKQSYSYNDDKITVSICMMPDVYHKHMEMVIYDPHGTEVYQIFDPGFIGGESLEKEPYFFAQEIPADSFEKGQRYTIEVHTSGIVETAFFDFGEKILNDICQNVSDETPIAVATNTRYYEMGDDATVFGCVLQHAEINEVTLTIGLGDELVLEKQVIPDESGYFSTDFVIEDKFRVAYWGVEASAGEELGEDAFVVTQRMHKSFFRTDDVESIINDHSWSNLTPRDISGDDKTLLLSGFQRIVTMNLEDKTFQEINIPINLGEYEVISNQKLSKTNTDEIFFIYHKDLYKLNTANGTAEKIIQDVEFFDLTSENKIIYSARGSNWSESEKTISLWSADSDGKNVVNIIENNKDIKAFDLSPDDSKILFTKSVLREPLWDKFVMIYDVETKQTSQVPELNIHCGSTPKWSPNGQLIVYNDSSCDRHFPEASLNVSDLDGNHGFLTDLQGSPSEYVISNDGSGVFYNLAPTGVYKMTLAQPIPEFGAIVGFVLLLTFLPILLIRKFSGYGLFSGKINF